MELIGVLSSHLWPMNSLTGSPGIGYIPPAGWIWPTEPEGFAYTHAHAHTGVKQWGAVLQLGIFQLCLYCCCFSPTFSLTPAPPSLSAAWAQLPASGNCARARRLEAAFTVLPLLPPPFLLLPSLSAICSPEVAVRAQLPAVWPQCSSLSAGSCAQAL